MFSAGIRTAWDVILLKLAILMDSFVRSKGAERAYVGHFAHDGGGHRGGGRGQERAAALALTTLEVTVGGADRVLAGRELVAVHGDAHGAAGFAPFGAGIGKDPVETLGLGLALHLLRARND